MDSGLEFTRGFERIRLGVAGTVVARADRDWLRGLLIEAIRADIFLRQDLERLLERDIGTRALRDLTIEGLAERAADRFAGLPAVIEHVVPPVSGRKAPPAPPAEPVPNAVPRQENPTGVPVVEKDHWIVVELVGENGEPIPGELCRITLPDGDIVERHTDSRGRVEEYGLEAGDCTVEFPDLDQEAWEAVA